jgi:DNA-binding SARP family transcriptional activator
MGGLALWKRNGDSFSLPTRKAEALFAYLALTGASLRRAAACTLLWGDVLTDQARHSLRQTLTTIRTALTAADVHVLVVSNDVIDLDWRQIWVDLPAAERLAQRHTVNALRLACALCRGDLLAGLHLKETGFDRWLEAERARVRQLSIKVHEDYANRLMQRADDRMAIEVALRLLALDPLHERAYRTLMTLYAKNGQMSTALRQYDLYAEILRRKFGVEPSIETQLLRRDLLLRNGVRT